MRAGKLRDVVDILTPIAQTKSSGEVFYTYKAETGNRRVPCSVRNVTQKKTEDGYIQNSGDETFELRMRYSRDIGYNTQFDWYSNDITKNRLRIFAIENIEEKNRELKILCERVSL